MNTEHCRNVIIGSGEGGKYLAWHLAESGEPTVVIERKYIGGSCPNINCLPAKNEIWSAKVANLVQRAGEFGSVTGTSSVDMEAVRNRKRAMVEGLIEVHKRRYKATGARLVMGSAKFVGLKTLEVHLVDDENEIRVEAERIFLNLGTHALIPAVPGLAECDPLTHIELLELNRLPPHLVVVGADTWGSSSPRLCVGLAVM